MGVLMETVGVLRKEAFDKLEAIRDNKSLAVKLLLNIERVLSSKEIKIIKKEN